MGDVVKLSDMMVIPDCKRCQDKTKYRIGAMFDVYGRGTIEPIYDCENWKCRYKKNDAERFWYYSDEYIDTGNEIEK